MGTSAGHGVACVVGFDAHQRTRNRAEDDLHCPTIVARTAIASRILRRCPTIPTPKSFRSPAVRFGRTVSSISLSRNAASYLSRLRLRSQTTMSMMASDLRLGAYHRQGDPERSQGDVRLRRGREGARGCYRQRKTAAGLNGQDFQSFTKPTEIIRRCRGAQPLACNGVLALLSKAHVFQGATQTAG
jgi:hypothetical protein